MRQLQTRTAEMPDVMLVSFTVDPAHDTPPVLADYAGHFKPIPRAGSSSPATGHARTIWAATAFKLNSVDGSLTHSTRFVLVDRRSQIRGFYSTTEDGALPQAVARYPQAGGRKVVIVLHLGGLRGRRRQGACPT